MGTVAATMGTALRCYDSGRFMDPDELSDYLAKIGRKGGHTRAKRMTPEQRKASATNASKAAAKARSKKAAERKKRRG